MILLYQRVWSYQRAGLAIAGCVFILFATTLATRADADVIFVPDDYQNIQSAIDAASNGDIIVLDDGVYTGQGNRDIRLHGKAITIRSAFGAKNCIVDAGGTPQKPYRGFVFESGETIATVIDGLTIRGGATLPGAVANDFNGGGLFFFQSSATIKNCIVGGNQCGCWGAGVYCGSDSDPVLINCDISNNHADDDGGALFAWNGGRATLINCYLNDNSAVVSGGAISDFGSSSGITLINCCLASNSAPLGSALIGSNITVVNSIIWGNTGGDQIYNNSATVNSSIVQGGYPGSGNINADPEFVNSSGFDYRLRAGSPGIDAADNNALPADSQDLDNDGDTTEPIPLDFDLRSRFVDDPNTVDSGNGLLRIADIGPFEFQPGPTVVIPESYLLTRGNHMGGGVGELVESDDSDLSIQRAAANGETGSEFEIKGTSPVAFPVSLHVELEGSVASRRQIIQSIELFDYDSGVWEQIDSRNAAWHVDATATGIASGDLSRFVQSGTHSIEARISFRSENLRQKFSSNTDRFSWTIE